MTEKRSLQDLIRFRKQKLEGLREGGVDPYPHTYKPTHSSAAVQAGFGELEDQDVVVAGRIMSLRVMGQAAFFHLQDQAGRIQIYLRRDEVGPEAYTRFKLLDIGDLVGVSGFVFKTRSGEISIHTRELTVLAKSLRPIPVVKEKEGTVYDAFTDKEHRYRNRHLDLIVNPRVREVFVKRARIVAEVRRYLDEHGFLEVETPVLQPLYGGANARPFQTRHHSLDETLYLRIADELYLKRLIIGGFDKVYELSKNFRNEGMDRNHNPEFTALEFYQAYADYLDMMDLVEDLLRSLAARLDSTRLSWDGREIDLGPPFQRRPLLELLQEATGEDLEKASDANLEELCKQHQLALPEGAHYGHMIDTLMKNLVEPQLISPTFVFDYPKAVSPLAKLHRNGNPNLVERFELFIGGVEFANAFTELNDPQDQRQRLEAQAALRAAGDEEAQPVDEDFISALESGMPPTGGVGIGIDRLIMLFTGQRWIKDVILFPALRRVDT